MTHFGFGGNWLVDTNERGSVQNFVKGFPAFGWGKMSKRSSKSKIEMVCRLLVKTSIKCWSNRCSGNDKSGPDFTNKVNLAQATPIDSLLF